MALVSRGDLIAALLRIVDEQGGLQLLRRVVSRRDSRTKMTWGQQRNSIRNWYEIPEVQLRQNRLITGRREETTFDYVAKKFLVGHSLFGVSLGCGTGSRELGWAGTGRFKRILAIDMSEERIEEANRKLTQAAFSSVVRFVAGDVLRYQLNPNSFDVVITEGILHHISPLEVLVDKIASSLKPDGILIVNEYIGPDKFQWTKEQVRFCNVLLSFIPKPLRTYRGTKIVKTRVFRPGTLSMRIHDPSEAVESSKIIERLKEKFSFVERKDYGGTILHPLLKDISHHFTETDSEKEAILQFLFGAENYLMRTGVIESDFTFMVARKV